MPLPNEHHFKFFSDPAHGWLEVPSKLLKDLDIEDQISEFSFVDTKKQLVYVEEDTDLLILKLAFEREFKQQLLDVNKVTHIESESESFIRSLKPYVEITVQCNSTRSVGKEITVSNEQKIALIRCFIDFYNSTTEESDNKLKSDIAWFATGLTKIEYDACKEVAQDVFKKGNK